MAIPYPHLCLVLIHTRQCNMQLSLFKSLHTMNRAVDVVHSYDINCQFAIHLMERFDTLPDDIKEVAKLAIKFVHVIPKLHIMGHMRLCQMCFSLNFHAGCGCFCGECIERMWSIMNGITLSTREMRPGRRADWIDFHMAHHNYMKQCSIGTHPSPLCLVSLLIDSRSEHRLTRGLYEAGPMVEEHYGEFELLDTAVKARDDDLHPSAGDKVRLRWIREFDAWVSGDQTGLCPFHMLESKARKCNSFGVW
jgi:hypothetical protein